MKFVVISIILTLGVIALDNSTAKSVNSTEVNTNSTDADFSSGDCNNDQDLKAFDTHYKDFHRFLEGCSKKAMGNPQTTANCLQKLTGNTPGCCLCFGKDSHCAAVHCITHCLFHPDSAPCLQCVKDNCYSSLLQCAKVDGKKIPP